MYNDLTKGNLVTIILSLIAAFISFLIAVYVIPLITRNDQIILFLTTIVSTIGAAFLVNLLWEIFAKKRFAESIFDVAKISKNIEQSGVDHIDTDFSSINWKAELSKTHNFTAIFTYAQTWRNSNRVAIQSFTRKKKNNFIVIMPDYENDEIMAEFDRRYNYDSGKTKSLIQEAVMDYSELGAKIYLYNRSLQATYYVMDNVALMAFFKHSPGKSTVPYIRAESTGSFYDYIEAEKKAILSSSVSVSVTTGERGKKIIKKEK
mgnify:CR=1 FL=1